MQLHNALTTFRKHFLLLKIKLACDLMWKYQLFIMASGERSYDVECQNNGENLLNQTQEDVTFLKNMTTNHFQVDADFFDMSDPEKRYNFQNESCQRLAMTNVA